MRDLRLRSDNFPFDAGPERFPDQGLAAYRDRQELQVGLPAYVLGPILV